MAMPFENSSVLRIGQAVLQQFFSGPDPDSNWRVITGTDPDLVADSTGQFSTDPKLDPDPDR